MKGQFLFDLIIGWVLYTKEGKDTANKLITNVVNSAKKKATNNNLLGTLVKKEPAKNNIADNNILNKK